VNRITRLLILAMIISVPNLTAAVLEDSTQSEPKVKFFPAEGSKALFFSYSLNTGLTSYNCLIAGKYHFSSTRALELRVNSEFGIENGKGRHSGPDYSDGKYDTNYQSLSVTTLYVRHKTPLTTFSPYWGFGPEIGYGFGSSRRENDANRDYYGVRKAEFWDVSIGALSTVGIEWFVHDRISIRSEYRTRLSYSYEWRKDTYDNWDDNTHTYEEESSEESHLTLENIDYNMGIAFYF